MQLLSPDANNIGYFYFIDRTLTQCVSWNIARYYSGQLVNIDNLDLYMQYGKKVGCNMQKILYSHVKNI